MGVSRRDFLKLSGGTVLVASLGVNLDPAKAYAQELRIKNAKQTTTICPYCSVGCGIVVYAENGKIINTEGDPDHPINEGALCAKGAASYQLVENPQRITKVQYRAPFSDKWEEKSWDWAITEIAKRVKKVRDASFTVKNAKDQVVNRTEAIASCGSAAMDNEECWTYQAMLRSLGLTYIEHQARI